MEFIGWLFVGKPLSSAAVAAVFLLLYAAMRWRAAGTYPASRWPLVAALAWGAYSAWEWLILVRTPDANIRVDLLLIYPALAVVSLWAVVRSARRHGAH
jgi:hypothetical protein